MKTFLVLIFSASVFLHLSAQNISKKLENAIISLEKDSQMKNAIIGFYVADQKSGEMVFAKNAEVGLAAASSQKVITSAACLELLGADYRYKTDLAYSGKIDNGTLKGNLYLVGNGDPTLGSWRYPNTKEQTILNNWIKAVRQAGINRINGNIICYNNYFESQTIPGGWIWDDIGNYYGAGVTALNWRENQYDLLLKSGNEGDKVAIVATVPKIYNITLNNELTAGKAGSGDNAYIYLPPYSDKGFIRGTIPPNQKAFSVSGSFPDPRFQLASTFKEEMQKQGLNVDSANVDVSFNNKIPGVTTILSHFSPDLDSINYWFLKKSINLYGEALVKTLGFEKKHEGSTEAGLQIIRDFWSNRSIDSLSINITDGSGLSPQNRVTAKALASVMMFARSRPWFSSFYNGLPEINGIKMKSGTINGVRSFTGYTSNYTFAVIINSYNGSAGGITKKMYSLLDLLK